MKYILRARDKGAVFVVIDPILLKQRRLADIIFRFARVWMAIWLWE